MSTVIEVETSAQLLPVAKGTNRLGTSWSAHQAADADLRARFPYWREVAARLEVVP